MTFDVDNFGLVNTPPLRNVTRMGNARPAPIQEMLEQQSHTASGQEKSILGIGALTAVTIKAEAEAEEPDEVSVVSLWQEAGVIPKPASS